MDSNSSEFMLENQDVYEAHEKGVEEDFGKDSRGSLVANGTVDELRQLLESLGLEPRGKRSALKKRLFKHKKQAEKKGRQMISSVDSVAIKTELDSIQATALRYFAVFDVEATCEDNSGFGYNNEIIEFPVVLLSAGQPHNVVSEFHSYVRPILTPQLSAFCSSYTGITQETVDAAEPFSTVLSRFDAWLSEYIAHPQEVCFVTDGPWDIRDFMQKQCLISRVPLPPVMLRFVDVRHMWTENLKRPKHNLSGMLHSIGLSFDGREHSGIDDARNIARIWTWMLQNHGDMVLDQATWKVVNVKKNVQRIQRLLKQGPKV